jgi:hypothetical protein
LIKFTRLLAATAAVATILTLGASAASASIRPNSSYGCQNNDGSPTFCGSQEFYYEGSGTLVLSVLNGRSHFNQPIVTAHDSSNPATDFDARNVNGLYGTGGPDKRFEYAPNGDTAKDLCISDPTSHVGQPLLLRHCNGSVWQTFSPIYVDGYVVAWESVQAPGQVITDTNFGGAGTRVTMQVWNGDTDQELAFVS